MTSVTLDPESVSHLVQKAILDSLTDEKKHDIVSQAITRLVTEKDTNVYGSNRGKTWMQAAFDDAVHIAARTLIRELLESDPAAQQGLRDAVSAPIAQIASGNYEGLPEAIGSAVASWLQERAR